mmetsp:Transcript_16359/g.25406  ORF Transcript_16359/g.25406 Transcript_16359/m.25406 type:complete len:115 (-) Transcript_16359:32-376(-)
MASSKTDMSAILVTEIPLADQPLGSSRIQEEVPGKLDAAGRQLRTPGRRGIQRHSQRDGWKSYRMEKLVNKGLSDPVFGELGPDGKENIAEIAEHMAQPSVWDEKAREHGMYFA